jgi:hypothetical protein
MNFINLQIKQQLIKRHYQLLIKLLNTTSIVALQI